MAATSTFGEREDKGRAAAHRDKARARGACTPGTGLAARCGPRRQGVQSRAKELGCALAGGESAAGTTLSIGIGLVTSDQRPRRLLLSCWKKRPGREGASRGR
jgi:hypothetical protein